MFYLSKKKWVSGKCNFVSIDFENCEHESFHFILTCVCLMERVSREHHTTFHVSLSIMNTHFLYQILVCCFVFDHLKIAENAIQAIFQEVKFSVNCLK